MVRLALIPLVAAVLGAGCGFAYSLTRSAPYESRSQVLVSPASGFLDPADANSFAAISNTVEGLALTQRVLSAAAAGVSGAGVRGLPSSRLSAHLRLSTSRNTPLITITGRGSSQKIASAVSRAETDALVNAIDSASNAAAPAGDRKIGTTTEKAVTAAANGLKLRAFTESEPLGRARIRTASNVLVGLTAGLLIGCFGVAQLLSRESRRVRPTSVW